MAENLSLIGVEMMSTRYADRWRGVDELAAEMELRRRVRAHLRENHPDIPPPPGGGWLLAESDWPCMFCPAYTTYVRVPKVAAMSFLYCPACHRVYEGNIGL
jgi:hypothetical protein